MQRGSRDSQTINNFFTFVTIVIMSIVIAIYSKYLSKENPNQNYTKEPLSCQKDGYSFDKVFDKKLLNEIGTLYTNNQISLNGGIIYSEYMPSKFINELNITKVDEIYLKHIDKKIDNNSSRFVNIKYEIIENDKDNPNKKSKECKLNSGSIMTSFRLNGKEAYRIFIDFQQLDLLEIEQKIKCSIKAFKNNAE